MRILPRSLRGRLLVGGVIFMTLAMIASTMLIGVILYRFVVGQVDQRLDLQIATIASSIVPDETGKASLRQFVDVPPFDRIGSGWYWQVEGAGVDLKSRSLGDGNLDHPPAPDHRRPPPSPPPARIPPLPPHVTTEGGEPLHARSRTIAVGADALLVTVTAPIAAITTPLRDAMMPLLASIVAIAAALLAASLIQVRVGLRPLARLSVDLREVRAGRMQRVPVDQPTELEPLVVELNALIDQNTAGLATARLHVANLAHGLKTPLASLALEMAQSGRDPDGSMTPLVEQMERGIRHHLGRARAAAGTGPPRAATALLPRINDLAAALSRIHADRGIRLEIDADERIIVACEGQDLDEMLGNLLDNAYRWAASLVRIEAAPRDRGIVISVLDDGPGLPEHLLEQALLPGQRIDETSPGHGFGLAITRELVELHGGNLRLCQADPHGLRAELTLPVVAS